MELPSLIPDPEVVQAAAWFGPTGAVKAATGSADFSWVRLEQLAGFLARHLDMKREALEWLVFEDLQLFIATRHEEALCWLTPAEADSHWVANALLLTLASLQQFEKAKKEPPRELAQPEPAGQNGILTDELVPSAFHEDFEQTLAKAVGPKLAPRLIEQVAVSQGLKPRKLTLPALDGFIHEISLQIPYRGRRAVFLTEVNQLIRSHRIPKRSGLGPQRISVQNRGPRSGG